MARNITGGWREAGFTFWLLATFLTFLFFTGGSSRSDVASLMLLRPAASIACGVALWTLKREQVSANPFLFGMAAAIIGTVALQLIPLPPGLWSALPGREIMVEADRVAGLDGVWRPMTMTPAQTWNALYALLIPLATLLLAAQLRATEMRLILSLILSLGLLSGLVGLLQAVGDPQSPLYFYQITNNGAAVGLFANRNHQAVLLACLFPMLATFASASVATEEQARFRAAVAAVGGLALIPLIMVTGSRAGLITGVIGLLSVFLLYRQPEVWGSPKRKTRKFNPLYLLAAFAAIALGALAFLLTRAEALQRIVEQDPTEDLRGQMWGPIADAALAYLPWGSGHGSFVAVYQIVEPAKLLSANYVNHAHNDWLELALTGGIPAIALLLIAIIAFSKAVYRAFVVRSATNGSGQLPRLGLILIALLALASVADYPLRTPLMAGLFVIFALWAANRRPDAMKSAGSH